MNTPRNTRIRSFKRRWQRFTPNLRRRGAFVTLGVLFALAIAGPLACILHCSVWYPLHQRAHGTTLHTHHHHDASPVHGSLGETANTVAMADVESSQPQPPDHPHQPLASALYECATVQVLILVLALLVQRARSTRLVAAAYVRLRPLLPPPIFCLPAFV